MNFKQWIAGRILINAPLSVLCEERAPVASRSFLEYLDLQMHHWALVVSDTFSENFWKGLQAEKLKRILLHAKKNTLFWRNACQKTGLDLESFDVFKELEKIPVITRQFLKTAPSEEFLAENVSLSRRDRTATSGSTSEPFKFYHDKRDIFRRRVNVFLELRHGGLPEKSSALILGLGALKGLLNYRLHVNPQDLEFREWRINKFYPLLNSAKPKILFSTPSYIRRLEYFCRLDKFSYKFFGIRFYGEVMDAAERKELEEFFKCGIYSTYGSQECSIIAIECKYRNFHTVPWLNYVEVVDSNGKAVKRGETGDIIVTFFENECVPFIRYALGDRGALLGGKCFCGRSSPLLRFEGRTLGFLKFTDGSVYHVSIITQYIAENFSNSIKRFQLKQAEKTKVVFRYIPLDWCEQAPIEERLDGYFRSIIRGRAAVSYEAVEHILPEPSGKTPIFIKG